MGEVLDGRADSRVKLTGRD